MAASSLSATGYASSAIDRSTRDLAASVYRLSSGNRYVTGEDSSSLTLAVQLQANAASLRQGLQNSVHAASLLETASSGLSRIGELLARARATAVTAQSETLTDAERIYLQTSLESDLATIDTIASTTRFHQTQLLNGDLAEADGGAALQFSTGPDADSRIAIDIRDASTGRLLAGATPSLLTAEDADDAVDAIDAAQSLLNTEIARLGGEQARIDFAADHLSTQIYGLDSAAGDLSDTDIREESTRYTLQLLQQQTALAALAQARKLHGGLLGLLSFGGTPVASATPVATTKE